MTKLSVIVPVYNMEKYLEKCLNSILNQTFNDMEVICVNDGSTDKSSVILEKYAQQDSRIKIINKANGGLSSARNAGLDIAQGEFVAFVDSDDWIEPETYKKSIEKFTNDVDMVVFQPKIIDGFEKVTQDYFNVKFVGKECLNEELITNSLFSAWNKVFRKSIIDKFNLRFPEGLQFEDIEFCYKYYGHIKNIYYLDEYFYNYLQREDSIMGEVYSFKNSKLEDYVKVVKRLYDYRNNVENKRLYKNILFYYLKFTLWNIYGWSSKELLQKNMDYVSKVVGEFNEEYFPKDVIKNLREKKYYKLDFLDYPNPNFIDISYKYQHLQIKLKNKLVLNLKIDTPKEFAKKINLTIFALLGFRRLFDFLPESKFYKNLKIKLEQEVNVKSAICSKVYDDNIIKYLKTLNGFYFCPNEGNLGDVIIAKNEFEFFDTLNFEYKILDKTKRDLVLNKPFNLVYGGGGLFVKYWYYDDILEIFKSPNLQKCVILPSSFWFCPEVLEVLDERFTVFCRERKSYEYCSSLNKKATFILAEDMGLSEINCKKEDSGQIIKLNYFYQNLENITNRDLEFIEKKILPKCKKLRRLIAQTLKKNVKTNNYGYKVVYFMREDEEKLNNYKIKNNIDLSLFMCSTCTDTSVVKFLSQVFIDAINSVDIIITDRLHVGIVGTLLGKRVFMLDNAYGKISGVYNYSLKKYNNVSLVETLEEINTDNLELEVPRYDFIYNKRDFELINFMKFYLSNLKFDNRIANTMRED